MDLTRLSRTRILLLLGCVALLSNATASAEKRLHHRIDELIEAKAGKLPIAAQSSDAEFLRRVFLDLGGRIPTVDEARAFIQDKSPQKREKLIDALLKGDDYPRRMQELFHVMFMERRGDNEEWTKFLRAAFELNLPWHQIATAILAPKANDEQIRGAAFFLTQRLVKEGAMAPVDVPGLTRDVGRLFAGVDLQCAQCHDHLTVDDYKQSDFQGLHMIFENVQTRRDVKFPAIAEKLMTAKKEYKSVFDQVAETTGPRIPGGREVGIPEFKKGEEYTVAPDRKKRTPGVPKFSPLSELANGLASGENKLFARNIVNRLWFTMMGRGLVEPLDMLHADNPATHPELFELLTSEFVAHDFNMQWLLREFALSKIYQRTSVLGGKIAKTPPRHSYTLGLEKRISAEQLFWSLGVATGLFDAVREQLKSEFEGSDDKDAIEKLKQLESASLESLVSQSDDLKEFFAEVRATFGNGPKEPEVDFTPTVKGALYLMHNERIQKVITKHPLNLIDQLGKQPDVDATVDLLFLAVFSRSPEDIEKSDVLNYLAANKDRPQESLSNIMWGALTSTEFMVNH